MNLELSSLSYDLLKQFSIPTLRPSVVFIHLLGVCMVFLLAFLMGYSVY